MSDLLHELLMHSAERFPVNSAIAYKNEAIDYETMADTVSRFANSLISIGLERQQRVAVYLPKRPENVAAMFGTTMAGGAFVPVNPLLKVDQVAHILGDCGVRILVTTSERLSDIREGLNDCADLNAVILLDSKMATQHSLGDLQAYSWDSLLSDSPAASYHRSIDSDMAAIFYTSGSTGKPKGVVLSHQNMVVGARSVVQYLDNRESDRLLAALPFSFDYGFSQLSTAFASGASITLMDYLFAKDVVTAIERYEITGLAGVPPLWTQLAKLAWPIESARKLRYITNSGGAMPKTVLNQLREKLPDTRVFLMYGLTEAFRSTYLDPDEINKRPESMGKAIPNAEILVVRDDGSPCDAGEPGELVHRGALVSLGYWNDTDKTAERFRPLPGQDPNLVIPEIAVWSGDTVVKDDEDFMFFVGRRDDMIKTSGYRVSPSEIEEAVYATGMVSEVVAIGIPHPVLGQGIVIVVVVSPEIGPGFKSDSLVAECRQRLPNFMIPGHVELRQSLPRNANGKIDRKRIYGELIDLFQEDSS